MAFITVLDDRRSQSAASTQDADLVPNSYEQDVERSKPSEGKSTNMHSSVQLCEKASATVLDNLACLAVEGMVQQQNQTKATHFTSVKRKCSHSLACNT